MSKQTETKTMRIADVRRDGGTQTRVKLDPAKVHDYKELLGESPALDGPVLPDEDVFDDDENVWLADGFHRIEAKEQLCFVETRVTVHKGTRRDAILFGIKANAKHGLPRTNADKRKCVGMLLEDSEWGKWSSTKIAKLAGVSDSFVEKQRRIIEQKDDGEAEERMVERKGKTYPMKKRGSARAKDASWLDAIHGPKTISNPEPAVSETVEEAETEADQRPSIEEQVAELKALVQRIVSGCQDDDIEILRQALEEMLRELPAAHHLEPEPERCPAA